MKGQSAYDPDDLFALFVKSELNNRNIPLTRFSMLMNKSPSYIGNFLNRVPRDGKPRGITLAMANQMLLTLGRTWHHYNRFIISEETRNGMHRSY